MASKKHNRPRPLRLRLYALVLAVIWTAIVAASLIWDMYGLKQNSLRTAYAEARASWDTEDLFRRWIVGHGGVYVLVTENTPPNPNLSHLEDRDTKTLSGKPLTLMNGAYVMRQLHELTQTGDTYRGHLASLRPIWPGNTADPWERDALQAFERGEMEVSGVAMVGDEPYMRFMRPLIMQQSCLKCHAEHGYTVGDVRGGISVSAPMAPHWAQASAQIPALVLGHGSIWILGLIGIGVAARIIGKRSAEREQSEEALQDSEERFRGLFEDSPVAIWEVDFSDVKTYIDNLRSTGVGDIRAYFDEHPEAFADCATMVKIVDVNRATLELYKARTKEELFTDFGRVITEESYDVMREDIIALAEGEVIFESESVAQDMDGKRVNTIVRRTIAPGHENTWSRIFVSAIDITERKRMEEELQKMEKLESVGILAGGIAHDLNNFLTGIVGNISLAMMYEDPREKDKRLAEAEKACMQIKDLTQQMLTFSKGGAPILQTAAIGNLLRDAATFTLRGSNVGCEFSIPDDLWPAEIDGGQINQVINNLIINSQQAMPGGGTVTIRAENMTIDTASGLPLEPGAYIKISVEDQGIGIPQDHLQKIFDPFFTTKQAGNGLGLATSYSIIEKHKGHIAVESRISVGTTFHIYLPASPEGVLMDAEEMEKKPIMGEGRVLVMDDEKHVRDTAASMLSSIGYEAITAIDGAEAIEIYKEAMSSASPFDAVIMDLTIPGGMGGEETIQRLMEIDPEVKAIVSSGYSNDPILANFREYGFMGFIAKPYKIQKLSEILHGVIAGAG